MGHLPDDMDGSECVLTTELDQLNSHRSDEENLFLDHNVVVQDDKSVEDDSFSQYSWPEDDDDDDWVYFYHLNDDLMITNHLNRQQLKSVEHFEEKNYQRSKQSNKKINAQRQIKTKYVQSLKINSHKKSLYMHHRLVKKVQLDPPSKNYLPSPPAVPLYSPENQRALLHQSKPLIRAPKPISPPVPYVDSPIQFCNYTVNESNIPNEPTFDDAMIAFLFDMQNRDLSPEDYEMLLRLDERVQRKTVDTNILDTLPTLQVNETHLNDQCTICLENYTLGQQLKLLPCTHIFHSDCIRMYLKEFSTQCPLDNLSLL